MRSKYHEVFVDKYTEKLGFLCRAINFLEDVYEDAECSEVYVDSKALAELLLVVKGVSCDNLEDSVERFKDRYDLRVVLGVGETPLRKLYDHVVKYYARTLRHRVRKLAYKDSETSGEYYLGVLFDGRGFILEGEENEVRVPSIPQCFSAHTHPSSSPLPSPADLKMITRLLVDRGVGHAIESRSGGLAIYRTAPLSLEDYEALRELESVNDVTVAIHKLSEMRSVKTRVIT